MIEDELNPPGDGAKFSSYVDQMVQLFKGNLS